jgi:hypothetical protein
MPGGDERAPERQADGAGAPGDEDVECGHTRETSELARM